MPPLGMRSSWECESAQKTKPGLWLSRDNAGVGFIENFLSFGVAVAYVGELNCPLAATGAR